MLSIRDIIKSVGTEDTVVTDCYGVGILAKKEKIKNTVYANRVAMNHVLNELKPTILISSHYSKNTFETAINANQDVKIYYMQDRHIGEKIDELEVMGGTTKEAVIHHLL